jgi:hypothetical protein
MFALNFDTIYLFESLVLVEHVRSHEGQKFYFELMKFTLLNHEVYDSYQEGK